MPTTGAMCLFLLERLNHLFMPCQKFRRDLSSLHLEPGKSIHSICSKSETHVFVTARRIDRKDNLAIRLLMEQHCTNLSTHLNHQKSPQSSLQLSGRIELFAVTVFPISLSVALPRISNTARSAPDSLANQFFSSSPINESTP